MERTTLLRMEDQIIASISRSWHGMLLHSCTTTENRSTCCPTIKRSLNLLPSEVDKATSPGAGDNMRPIVGEGGVLGEQQHGGINQRIPRMPRATGFNYSGGRSVDENSLGLHLQT